MMPQNFADPKPTAPKVCIWLVIYFKLRALFLEGIWAFRATSLQKKFPNSIFHPGSTKTHVEQK
jgi:hypothetical protein